MCIFWKTRKTRLASFLKNKKESTNNFFTPSRTAEKFGSPQETAEKNMGKESHNAKCQWFFKEPLALLIFPNFSLFSLSTTQPVFASPRFAFSSALLFSEYHTEIFCRSHPQQTLFFVFRNKPSLRLLCALQTHRNDKYLVRHFPKEEQALLSRVNPSDLLRVKSNEADSSPLPKQLQHK